MKTLFHYLILGMFISISVNAAEMQDLIERKEIQTKIEKEILKMDIGFNIDIFSADIIEGINLSSKYRYVVEPSYQDKYYTRIDKWDLNTNISPGTILKDVVEIPFSFGVNRNNSFIFVRQFQSKTKSIDAIPYTPAKLPITANRALKLATGDFVAIPANLNLAVGVGASAAQASPIVMLNAGINSFFVVSGEFTIQVFKLDDTHVRLKLISSRSQNVGATASFKAEIDVAGFRIFRDDPTDGSSSSESGVGGQLEKQLDKQIGKQAVRFVDRLIDRDFLDFGINYTPGASFIADYIFDLSDEESKAAYNQILSSAYKLKEILVFDNFFSGSNLKDKLLMTTELADKLSDRYKNEPYDKRKVTRIFKGFNNYKSFGRHIKLGVLFASYQHNTTYVENKITFIDKNEQSIEFFYPTFSKYFENNLGKWIFNIKDQSNKVYFGLIPRRNSENVDYKNPDLGLTYERKDKTLTRLEHKKIGKFIANQLPLSFIRELKLDNWRNGSKKLDSRIYFQVVLKSQGFNFLRTYSKNELTSRLIEYLKNKKLIHVIVDPNSMDTGLEVNNNENATDNTLTDDKIKFELIDLDRYVENSQVKMISSVLYNALHGENRVSEETLVRLLKLNEIPLFSNVGMGFLISLLPEDSLEDFIYINLDMIAKDVDPIKAELGVLNYKALYNEINTLQSRLSNRSYDLRVSKDDLEIGEMDNSQINLGN